ncbi:MAG: capsular polysaccharide biosynthesis protein [Alphaproteobacteria bacterium]|nr:capsular polysaccharide biosynthesis protein [Alphaproteobacteria bacterium]MBU1525436.1 capsular polysaccharide biosynthesis protein [Alphaproteobacteria bacterium]MBU2116180.1 capsular polysaccharide biosynthesis protein [Alphaproteobacteria bacterium]MBU2352577.1 capsular polysaccharide biosynthesis protein [Alphaproteobacteria bacterium]MBU2381781.1 capsular polysaccharide biosynthesis protein [Alphaproteobacteria bacterium]
MLGLPHRRALLPEFAFRALPGPDVKAALGWGLKPSSAAGRAWSRLTGLPYVALEDGFLRSVGLGEAGTPSISLIVDQAGAYYDCFRGSMIEGTIAGTATRPQRLRARALMEAAVAHGLSKTNLGRPLDPAILKPGRRILIVDQTAGDASIPLGHAGPWSFAAMLAAARRDEPDAQLIVKRHPAVAAGLKRGCLDLSDASGLTVVDDVRAADLLDAVDAVYAVTSGLGFEALWRRLPVRLFGAPFYAGWGLTRDEVKPPRRGVPRAIEDVVHAALVAHCRWLDPVTGRACTPEEAIDRLAALTRRARRLEGRWHAVGFTPPKRGAVKRLMNSPFAGRITFHPSASSALSATGSDGGHILVWAGREPPDLAAQAKAASVPLYRMEDGFLRSRGLGSDFTPALSAVLDGAGVHYDPSRPSDLETLIQTGVSPADRARGARLRDRIVAAGLSKYNLGGAPAPDWPGDRERILVLGQVEDDRSVLLGCATIRTNAALLAEVRRLHPDAFLVWRDHPDVRAGNRIGALPPEAAGLADACADDLDVVACIAAVDAVAVMTSTAGFEALMRGKRVLTFGQPFYAGWGLTQDALPIPRRTARPDLDDLVAAALILHPLHVAPNGLPCEAEDVVAALEARPAAAPRRSRLVRALTTALDRRPPPAY